LRLVKLQPSRHCRPHCKPGYGRQDPPFSAHFPWNFFHVAEGERWGHQEVQELLRHASNRITLDIYTKVVTPTKRAAQTKVVEMIVGKPKQHANRPEKVRASVSNLSEPTPSSTALVKSSRRR
jgi:hypothetical protein